MTSTETISYSDFDALEDLPTCLHFAGWTSDDDDPEAASGYVLADFFGAAGEYLGPDVCGVEPLVRYWSAERQTWVCLAAGDVRRDYR